MAASDNLRLQVILAAVDRATGPFRRVLSGSRGVATALRNQRDALRQLNSQHRDIGAYREQVALAQRAKAALDAQRQSVRTLAQQIKSTGTRTAAMNAEFERAVRTARELKTAHGAQEAGLQRLRGRLETAGISTRELVTHERRLRGEIESTNTAMRAQQQRLVAIDAAQRRSARIQSAGLQASAYGAGMAFAGQRALRASVLPISDAMEFESAMADVRKVVDFKTPQQFLQMGRDVENLSMRLPMLP
ncbi:phage tail tape measure protein, partial [Xanthomonas arboricola pv. corylina]